MVPHIKKVLTSETEPAATVQDPMVQNSTEFIAYDSDPGNKTIGNCKVLSSELVESISKISHLFSNT